MKLECIVEIYEPFVGGGTRGKGRGHTGNKAVAVGAIERGGKLVLDVIRARDRQMLHDFIAAKRLR